MEKNKAEGYLYNILQKFGTTEINLGEKEVFFLQKSLEKDIPEEIIIFSLQEQKIK